jgi:hypothetical protein
MKYKRNQKIISSVPIWDYISLPHKYTQLPEGNYPKYICSENTTVTIYNIVSKLVDGIKEQVAIIILTPEGIEGKIMIADAKNDFYTQKEERKIKILQIENK